MNSSAKLLGFVFLLRNFYRDCRKLKKVSWRRFRECIQVKNLLRFCILEFWLPSTFHLIWKLFQIYKTILVDFVKNRFFLSVETRCKIWDTFWRYGWYCRCYLYSPCQTAYVVKLSAFSQLLMMRYLKKEIFKNILSKFFIWHSWF